MNVRRALPIFLFLAAASLAWGTINITPATLPNGVVSGSYAGAQLGSNPTVAGITWSVYAGALPPGVALNSQSGAITASGSLTTAGSFTFTILAATTGPNSDFGFATYTVNVIGITTNTPLPGGVVGGAYSQSLTAAGDVGPDTWTMAGTAPLPPGLSITNGAITGTPTAGGTYVFSVRVTDSSTPPNTTTGSFSLTITQASISPSTLPGGTVGNSYSQQLSTSPAVAGLTWAVTIGALPTGLSISPGGLISGQLTGAGTFNFTITATAAATVATAMYEGVAVTGGPLTLNPNPTVLKAAAGVAFTAQLAATGGVPPYTFILPSGAQNGINISTAGVVSGTPAIPGATNLQINVRDNQGNQVGSTVTVNAIGITTTSLPSGTIGTPYSQQLGVNGAVGNGAPTWTLLAGAALPPGLGLNASGIVSGTPTANGTYPFGVMVTDGTGNSTSGTVTIVIGTTGTLTITSSSPLTPATVNVPYTNTLSATGGVPTYTWTVTPGTALPSWLTLSSAGVLSGTPPATSTNTLSVTVTDSASPTHATASATLTLVVGTSVINITTTSPLTPGTINVPYTTTLQASGGTTPYTWSVTAGTTPPGLGLTPSTGVFSGTPTANGTYTFTVMVADSATPQHTATASLTMVIGTSALSITTTSPLPSGTVGTFYSQALAAAGGTAPYTWRATGLPAGLALSSTGVLSGAPTASGTTSISVTVTDSATPTAGTATASLSITINATPVTITTTSPLTPGPSGFPYSKTLTAIGGTAPYTWIVSPGGASLPAGLTLSSAGVISGTPTTAGSTTFPVTVTDSSSPAGTASASLTLVITTPTLTVTGVTASCFVATANRPFPDSQITPPPSCPTNNTYQFTATGGTGPYSFAPAVASALPPGVTLASSGVLRGTPTTAGTYTFTAVATDSLQAQGAVNATIVVGSVGQPSSVTITLGGSAGPTIANPQTLQQSVVLSIGNTFPFPVNGTATVSFVSSVGGLNTLVAFASGPTATFRIPAGVQTATVGPIAIGTQAGTITLTATQFTDDFGNILTPATPATVTYNVAPAAPVITNVTVSNSTASGFTLAVTGYSTTRTMTSAQFNFTPASGVTLAAPSATVQLSTQFAAWYGNPQSNPFGSTFVLTIPFTFSTSTTKPVTAVTVTMTNPQGTSAVSNSVSP